MICLTIESIVKRKHIIGTEGVAITCIDCKALLFGTETKSR